MEKVGLAVAVAAGLALAGLMMLLVVVASEEPAARPPGMVCVAPGEQTPGASVAGFEGTQLAHAGAIVAAGVEMGAPQQALVVAVATAMQESGLWMYANSGVGESLTLPHERVGSDHDSVGLFQQRAGWGPMAARMDAASSARLFYARLLALPGWQDMPLAQAAQSVQVSAFPDAYTRWEDAAQQVVGAVLGIACQSGMVADCGLDLAPLGAVRPWVADAASFLGCQFGRPPMLGVGSRPRRSDHPLGKALDVMTSGTTGDAVAACALQNREALGVTYVIWRQRINYGGGWEPMADRGSITENHFDHVHISFNDRGGTGPLSPGCAGATPVDPAA